MLQICIQQKSRLLRAITVLRITNTTKTVNLSHLLCVSELQKVAPRQKQMKFSRNLIEYILFSGRFLYSLTGRLL